MLLLWWMKKLVQITCSCSLVSNVLHTRAFGTRIQLHYLLEQERVIWTRFFIHHSNGPRQYENIMQPTFVKI